MITADLLTRISLFAKVPENERNSLAARAADLHLRQGEWLLVEGQAPAFFGLLDGRIDVYKIVGGEERRIASYGPGDYFGEVPLLLGAPAIASLQAAEPARLMRLEPADFLYLVSHCPVLSGEITRTWAARVKQVGRLAVDSPAALITVIGDPQDAACYDVREFLSRNRVGFTWQQGNGRPVVLLADGSRLEAPNARELAKAVGLQTAPKRDAYDVVIVGGGPAGLAAAVYGASEGLRALLVERIACGGQAGTSSRIENYLGFPGGLGGDELSARAYRQALRFGAELMVSRSVERLEPGDAGADQATCHTVVLDGDARVSAQTVILATGVEWRRLTVPGIERLMGHGVHYGAARSEAMRMQGRTVHLIGGGNSAGQAALFFADYASSVTMLVRGRSLAASMSQYLVDQLYAKANVTVETETEVVGLEGSDTLEALEVVTGPDRRRERRQSDALFVLIGGQAATTWLPERIICDQWGYVCTGRDVLDLLPARTPGTWPLDRDPYLLETSVPGILAAGDVRHGSIKRVSAGVGEGCTAIAVVHQYLAELSTAAR
ncbi:MAG TPA: FAD-dependent oxidoreductase [Gemmatimonadales bacterium]|jgi:thioredoxin reductase (NADPH)